MGAQKLFGASVALWAGFEADTGADIQKPLGYEDYLSGYLDGFQNAYLAGKMGNEAALKNSSAAAYLTEEQRELAYYLGARLLY